MPGRKVIMIGGTSFSGSTMLDMILGNDRHAFSCGEVVSLFQPTRTHHIHPVCGCGNRNCNIWSEAKKAGENKFIKHLFDTQPNLNTIVISAKKIPWIYEQTRTLQKQGIDVVNVLIWKSPVDFAYSMHKRKRLYLWERFWIGYHKVYFNLIRDYHAISYSDLISNESAVKELCQQIGMDYFPGKLNYWEKVHHTLFGNATAKYHLYAENTQMFKSEQSDILSHTNYDNLNINQYYRKLYSSQPPQDFVSSFTPVNKGIVELVRKNLTTERDLAGLKISYFNFLKILMGYRFRKFQRKHGLIKLSKVK